MGIHPSLKRAAKKGANNSVMKRTERIKWLIAKGKWSEKDSVLGLPKIRIIKLKAIKKDKAKEGEEGVKAGAAEKQTAKTDTKAVKKEKTAK
ncbi:MAG: small basic protein [Candidatus Omnitrophota bacterium]